MRPLQAVLLGSSLAASLSATTSPRPSFARSPAPPAPAGTEPDELKRFEAAIARVDLSPEQQSKVSRLLREIRASVSKIENTPGDPAQTQARINVLRTKMQAKLDRILTVAQDRQLKKLMADPRAGSAPQK